MNTLKTTANAADGAGYADNLITRLVQLCCRLPEPCAVALLALAVLALDRLSWGA
ncbi:hypothetical protein [Chitinimonas sp.]|uniref:hypothetical protein n=1 Tax=Chitinimonas sp. TaxID=1934313 RepID=UPI0035B1A7F1